MEQPPSISHASMWQQMFEDDDEDHEEPIWWWTGHGPHPLSAELRSDLATDPPPDIMLQAVVMLGPKTTDGHLIELVTPAWFKIVELMLADKNAMYQLDATAWEALVAGAYSELGFEVVLTPRSDDGGRDVIATRNDVGSIRFFDQVKRYSPGRRVTANDVRALLGVLNADRNVSKGIVTTTAEFAPGIEKDPDLSAFMPYRLELRSGKRLLEWLRQAYSRRQIPRE